MNAKDLVFEITHSTDMLRAAMRQYAHASACDLDFLANEARFWHGNRARARRMLASLAH